MRRVIPLVDRQREHLGGQFSRQRPFVSLYAIEGPVYRAVDPMLHQTAAQGVAILYPNRQDQWTCILRNTADGGYAQLSERVLQPRVIVPAPDGQRVRIDGTEPRKREKSEI